MSGTVNIETGRLIMKRRDGQVNNVTVQKALYTGSTSSPTSGVPADILAALLGVDGTGSSLDADKLDGQHGSFYAPIDSPSFTGNLNHSGAVASLANDCLVFSSNEIWTQNSVNADASLFINHRGYNSLFTRFRNTKIGNGKGGVMAYFDAVNNAVGLGTMNPQALLHIGGDYTNKPTYPGQVILRYGTSTAGPQQASGLELVQADVNSGYGMKLYTNSSADKCGIATRHNSATWTERLSISTVNGSVIFSNALTSPSFTSGFAGNGWKNDDTGGEYTLTVDNLIIRKALTAYELDINKINSINGGIVVSVANGKALTVSGTTIYMDEDNGNKQIQFAVDDYIRAQIWTGRGVASYVGRVTAVNHSTTYGSANIVATTVSGTPWNGMELVQIGNASTAARQNLIYITASDTNNPYIDMLAGVNAGSFSGKQKLRIGNLTGITDATYGALSGYGLWADNVYLTGWVKANSGFIGAWTIDSTSIKKDTGTDATSCGMAPADYPFYAGSQYSGRATAPFRVTNAGALTATGIVELGTATALLGGIDQNCAIKGSEIWENAYNGDHSGISFNRIGYNGGQTKFRTFAVFDGKGHKTFVIQGSTPAIYIGNPVDPLNVAVDITGSLTVSGNIDFSSSSSISFGGNHVVVTGTTDITCGAAEGDMGSMSTSFTPKGNKILITFSGSFYAAAANQSLWLIINVAGTNVRAMNSYIIGGYQPHALTYIASVTPGSAITVKMRWSGGANIQQRGTQDGYRVMTITDLH